VKHLLGIDDLGADGIDEVLRLADSFLEVTRRDIPKVPALRGKTVVSMFYEDSTRTRLSFETAAKRLSADTMTFSAGSSSLRKGESLLDTVRTVEAMGIDAIVVRHKSSGVPQRISGWIDASIVNAGDGWHEHPTQALLDAFTLRRHRGESFAGMKVSIVGDIKHSRVARSNVKALSILGAEVTLVGPPTLMPPDLEGWPVTVSYDIDEVLPSTDVLYVLRIQRERQQEALFPSLREYATRYGVTSERLARLPADALVMHPGPTNRGVEIDALVADDPRSVINEQVANGVAVRMAVLYMLLGSGEGRAA
jgi:aspartate carbamoyltransferase catalytic subunit